MDLVTGLGWNAVAVGLVCTGAVSIRLSPGSLSFRGARSEASAGHILVRLANSRSARFNAKCKGYKALGDSIGKINY